MPPIPKPKKLTTSAKRRKTLDADAAFRDRIWVRDEGRDRATGQLLSRRSDDWNQQGDVCHLRAKSIAPELRYSTSNAVLLSRRNHILSDGRGGYLLKILGDDANKPLTFRRVDKDGVIVWEVTR